nr:DNA-directed DNA polymerase [Tanacetum cinerariifolium]
MADRTMEELLQAPSEGYGEVIVISEILAENFEIKTNLLQLVKANKFHGRENDNPHTHISNFKRMTATGDIHLIEKLLNADPCSLPPMDLKLAKESKDKSFIKEPPELELKDLPSHLEYAFLEDSNKLPVIIAKNLKVDEREALLNVLNQWVSPIQCVPKKGGITVVANENNELIPTRLVSGWRVCIDYRKLNDATRKDHFPLPFMDQMLERKLLRSSKLAMRDLPEAIMVPISQRRSLGSTAQVEPPVVPILIPEPNVPRTQPNSSILYPSRL